MQAVIFSKLAEEFDMLHKTIAVISDLVAKVNNTFSLYQYYIFYYYQTGHLYKFYNN